MHPAGAGFDARNNRGRGNGKEGGGRRSRRRIRIRAGCLRICRHDYQDGVAFLFHNYGVVGAEFTCTLFDGGKRRSVIAEREAQRAQAMENLRRLKDDAAANVERALDKMEQNKSLINVAKQVVDLRTEAARIAEVQLARGVVVSSKRSEASAALAKSGPIWSGISWHMYNRRPSWKCRSGDCPDP
jgi:hypothetical protein